jgi:hypothetical protein
VDLNEIKNRAKDILADLTDNRPDREAHPEPRRDDAVDDSAVRTDRLEQPLQRPATDPHDAELRDPDLRDPDLRDPDLRDPDLRDPDRRDPDRRDPDRRDPDRRDSELRDSELRDPDLRDSDRRDSDRRDPDLFDPEPPREPRDRPDVPPQAAAPGEPEVMAAPLERHQDPAPADQLDGPGRHHLRDTSAQPSTPSTPNALDADGLPADPNRLVTAERAQSYSARWDEVKGEFVDEPRQAVVKADALVGELLDELGQLFTQQRRGIEQDLDNDEVSTEDLRVALRRYRSFFDRLLSV